MYVCMYVCVCVSTSVRVCVCQLLPLRTSTTLGFLPVEAHNSLIVARLCTAAGDQAGYIVAWSTKLAMYPRIWKWDAISTHLQMFNLL